MWDDKYLLKLGQHLVFFCVSFLVWFLIVCLQSASFWFLQVSWFLCLVFFRNVGFSCISLVTKALSVLPSHWNKNPVYQSEKCQKTFSRNDENQDTRHLALKYREQDIKITQNTKGRRQIVEETNQAQVPSSKNLRKYVHIVVCQIIFLLWGQKAFHAFLLMSF